MGVSCGAFELDMAAQLLRGKKMVQGISAKHSHSPDRILIADSMFSAW
jgi:hypothetical protein